MANSRQRHVLSGVRVLDFTQNLAGPSCTRMLVEMGADVVKIEHAPRGDRTRGAADVDRSLVFVQQNRGKRSVCVNFKDPRGLDLVKRLVAEVDVVMESYRPGAFARLGLGYDVLADIKPDIVLCSLSAMGQTGPLADRPGYDYIAQAYAGVTSMIGDPDEAPYIPCVGMGDVSTGVHAALGIVAALRHRDLTGVGQHVDVSLLDAYYHYHELNVNTYSASGGSYQPMRNGRHMTYLCPAGVFRTPNGDIVIMGHGQHWKDLCRAMDREDLITDERFKNDPARLRIQDEVVALVETWLERFAGRDEAVAFLEQFDVPVGPVLTVPETTTHPHLRARRTVRTITDEIQGEFDIPGMPIKFSAFPEDLPLEAARLGQHNAEVLAEYLDMSAAETAGLVADGVLAQRDPAA